MEGAKPAPTTEVKTPPGTEVLLLTPDGKLIGRAAGRDEVDQERIKREKEYTERVADTEGKEDARRRRQAATRSAAARKPYAVRSRSWRAARACRDPLDEFFCRRKEPRAAKPAGSLCLPADARSPVSAPVAEPLGFDESRQELE